MSVRTFSSHKFCDLHELLFSRLCYYCCIVLVLSNPSKSKSRFRQGPGVVPDTKGSLDKVFVLLKTEDGARILPASQSVSYLSSVGTVHGAGSLENA